MAVSYVAAGTYTAGTGSSTPPIPAGAVAGDIMVLLVETANEAVANDSTLQSAGWTPFSSSPQGTGTAAGTAATRLTSYYKRHTGTESNPNLGDAGDHTGGIVMVFRGCKASGSPIDADAGSVASSASTSVSCPTITTTGADRMVVAAVAWSTDSAAAQASGWTNANLTGLTERQDSGSTAGNGGGISVATGVMATAGAVGATTATLGTSSVQGRIQFALIPEPIADGDHTVTANDSGSNYCQASSWPPATPTNYVGNDDGGTTIYLSRNLSGGTYTVDAAYVTFDLASLAGGSPVSAAVLRLYVTAKTDNDARYGIRAEIYDFGGASDSGDWVAEVTSPVVANAPLSGVSTSAYLDLPLTDLTGVVLGSTVGFRLTLFTTGTAAPAAQNTANLTSHTGTNKPQLVVTLGGGTTPVGRTLGLVWHTRATVGRTRQLAWHVRGTVGRTRQVVWHTRATVGRTAQAVWHTRSRVGRTIGLRWHTRATAGRTTSIAWHTRTPVAATSVLRWNVRALATATADLRWHTRTTVGKTVELVWDVLAPVGVAGRTATLLWHTRATVGQTANLQWDVRRTVGRTGVVTWHTRAPVGRTVTARWHTRARVGRTTALHWDVRGAVGATITIHWNVRATRGRTVTLRWRVAGEAAGFGVVSAVYRTATITAALQHAAPTVTAHHHTAPTITGDH